MRAHKIGTPCLQIGCLALVLLVTLGGTLTETRYLPTRSDESEIRALKDIIMHVLNEAKQNQRQSGQALRPFGNDRANKLLARQNSVLVDNLMDEDQFERVLQRAAYIQRRSAELVAPNSNDGDQVDLLAPNQTPNDKRQAFLKDRADR